MSWDSIDMNLNRLERDDGHHDLTTTTFEIGMISAIACWYECLHGKSTLHRALGMISEAIHAEAIVLARVPRRTGGSGRLVAHDTLNKPNQAPAIGKSFARTLLGPYLEKSKPGSAWFSSLISDQPEPSLEQFQRRRRLAELVIIPLAMDEKHIDLLEIHFPSKPGSSARIMINHVAEIFAQSWRNRAPGTFTNTQLRFSKIKTNEVSGVPILSMENPARLSRAEFRVCVMLSKGKSVSRAQEELAISSSTVRAHLRNIYDKTGVESLSELLYQLISLAPYSSNDLSQEDVA